MKMSHKVIIAVTVSGLLLTGCASSTASTPTTQKGNTINGVNYYYAVIEMGGTYIYIDDVTDVRYGYGSDDTVTITSQTKGVYRTSTKNVILSDMQLRTLGR